MILKNKQLHIYISFINLSCPVPNYLEDDVYILEDDSSCYFPSITYHLSSKTWILYLQVSGSGSGVTSVNST